MCLISVAFAIPTFAETADNDTSAQSDDITAEIPEDTLVTYGYLLKFKDELRKEIIEELSAEGGIKIESEYTDVSLKAGQVLVLSPECEIIYRGGGAVAVTSSFGEGEGLTDMSVGGELFSGEPLSFGHIYHASESDSKKSIVVTGDSAYFTVRGEYEVG